MKHQFLRFRAPLQIERKSGGYINGRWTEGTPTTFSILGDIQPTKPNDLDQLPEGRRIDDTLTLYTDTILYSEDDRKQNPDIVLYEGKRYEVLKSFHWHTDIIPHYKVIIGKSAQGL